MSRYLVSQNCIKPLCDLLTVSDAKIIHVALDGLENILRVGADEVCALKYMPKYGHYSICLWLRVIFCVSNNSLRHRLTMIVTVIIPMLC